MFKTITLFLIYFSLGTTFIFASYDNLVADLFDYHNIKVHYPDSSNFDVFVSAKDISLSLLDLVVTGVEDTLVTYKDLSVKASQIRFSLFNNSLDFFDSVKVKKDSMSLTCDNAKITFPSVILVNGNVNFSYADYESFSEEAMYRLDKNLITLLGNAVLSNQDDYFKGDKIVFDLDNESVLSGGRSKIKLSTKRFQE